jgi:hypothetical protein
MYSASVLAEKDDIQASVGGRVGGPLTQRETHYRRSTLFLSEGSLARVVASIVGNRRISQLWQRGSANASTHWPNLRYSFVFPHRSQFEAEIPRRAANLYPIVHRD